MSQQFHIKRSNHLTDILAWLTTLPDEKKANGTPLHHLQGHHILYGPLEQGGHYTGTVLCYHSDLDSVDRILRQIDTVAPSDKQVL